MKKNVLFIVLVLAQLSSTFAQEQVMEIITLEKTNEGLLDYTIETRAVGEELLKLCVSLTNRCDATIEIKLSAKKKSWEKFTIKVNEMKLFDIGNFRKIYLWIDPENNPKTKHIIYKGEQYEIRWSSMEDNYMLKKM